MNYLVTGYHGEAHVTAAQQGVYNAGTVGESDYILPIGNKLAATIVDNNTIRISDGALLMQGRFACVENAEDLTISSGVAGENRIDIVVMRYEKNSTSGVESASLVVLEGETTTETATAPTVTEGDILSGDILHETALWQINISGINVESVELLCDVAQVTQDVIDRCDELEDSITTLEKSVSSIEIKINLPRKTDIDLNNLITAGTYLVSGTLTNSPDGCTYGWVQVFNQNDTQIKQVFYRHGLNNTVATKIFVRNHFSDGTWSEWTKLALETELPVIDSGTISLGSCSGNNGTVSKQVTFSETFTDTPAVVVTPLTTSTNLRVWISYVSATYFVVTAMNTGTSTMSDIKLSYIAK